MPKLIALRPLYGDYGQVSPGQVFEADAVIAEKLETRGLAERYHEPREEKMLASPENKMQVAAPENKAITTEDMPPKRKRGRPRKRK
jgi:hypothetical protein